MRLLVSSRNDAVFAACFSLNGNTWLFFQRAKPRRLFFVEIFSALCNDLIIADNKIADSKGSIAGSAN